MLHFFLCHKIIFSVAAATSLDGEFSITLSADSFWNCLQGEHKLIYQREFAAEVATAWNRKVRKKFKWAEYDVYLCLWGATVAAKCISSRGSTAVKSSFPLAVLAAICGILIVQSLSVRLPVDKFTFQHQEKVWRCLDMGDCRCFGSVRLLLWEHPPTILWLRLHYKGYIFTSHHNSEPRFEAASSRACG